MGRSAVRGDLRRRPQTFSLGERELAFIQVYAERHEVGKSQALRRILHEAEMEADGQMKRDLALRRVELASEARKEQEKPEPVAKCPMCGDADLYVPLGGGRWRCDNCLAAG